MKQMQKQKMVMQQPDMSISKQNQDKASLLFDNFTNGTNRQVEKNLGQFSSFAMIKRLITRSKDDPSDKYVLEAVKRLEKDKIHSQVAMQLSELCRMKAENLQKITLIKMIPFFIGMLGVLVLGGLILAQKPLEFTNPAVQKFLIPMVLFLPLLVWGLMRRKEAKLDMVTTNIVLQASAAYASAKMQGKGSIGALQNLEEMRRRAKSHEAKSKGKSKSKK